MLLGLFNKVGLRANDTPDADMTGVLCHFIVTNYGGHSVAEVNLAFDMLLTRRLDLPEREIPCYGNFSCEYFAKVMAAYRVWAIQEYRQLEGTRQTAGLLEGPKEDLSDEGMQGWLNDTILAVQAGQRAIEFLPLQLYDWLLIRGEILVGNVEKWEYMRKAVHRRQAFLIYMDTNNSTSETRQELTAFMGMKKTGCYRGGEIHKLKTLAKQIILWEQITGKAYEIPTDEESNG